MRVASRRKSTATARASRSRRDASISKTAPPSRIRLLILEDTPSDAELMIDALRQAGLDPQWERVDSEAEFVSRLTPAPDVILSDYALPQFNGLRALRLVRSRGLDVPFILVSGSVGEDIAVQAMREGADDYLVKDRMARLGLAVTQAIEKRKLLNQAIHAEANRTEIETRFRSFMEHLPGRAAMRDKDGRFVFVNARWCRAFGLDESAIIGRTPENLFTPERAAEMKAVHDEVLATGQPMTRRVRIGAGGADRWWLSFHFPIPNGHGSTSVVGTISIDITEQKAQEERVARLSRVQAVLSSVNSAIVNVRDRQALFAETCRVAVEHGGFGMAWIGVLDKQTLDITPVARAGLDADQQLGTANSSAKPEHPHGQGVVGQAIRQRKPIFSNDLLSQEGPVGFRAKEAVRRGYRSRIALPLMTRDDVFGVIVLFAKEKGFFTEDELKLLKELADNVSFALDHIAGEQKIEKLSRIRAVSGAINSAIVRSRNKQVLFHEACRIAVEHGRFGICWIGELNAQATAVAPVASAGLEDSSFLMHSRTPLRGESALPRAVRERRPVWANDITVGAEEAGERRREAIRRGYRSVIVLPFIVDGAVVGTFSIFAREINFFDDEEVTLLTEMAGNLSFALEHMRRQQKIEKLSRIRLVLSEINAAIARIRDREELLRETCNVAAEHGKFDLVWIAALDQEKEEVRPVAWLGFSREAAHGVTWASIRAAKGTLGEAVLSHRPAIRNDIEAEMPSGVLRQEALANGCGSTVCVPLVVDDKVVAEIVLFATGKNFFDEEELALLNELSADVSLALQTIERQERLDYLSYYDTLTDLPNRSLFIDRAGQQMHVRSGEPVIVALVVLNIERFRNINESLGRHGGDELLKAIARRLESAFQGKDYLARIGADGFGVVIRGLQGAAATVRAVEDRILGCFQEPFTLRGTELRVAAKAGIAMFPADGADADALFRNAEAALQKAKESGERYLFYAAEMNARAAQALSLETRLRKAVEAQQFVLHYQPKVDLASGAICGLEALIRWQDPDAGLVPPGAFIPVLEQTGLIREVGQWALSRALADYRDWRARGCAVPRVAVNVSAIQLQQRDFTDVVINAVQAGGDVPEALELEVTESLIMRDIQESIRKLSVLRGRGIHVAMDDFGTGYSSLSYFARLPINSLKIDRSFINAMAGSEQDMAIVTTIIALTHSLKLKVVAEGVETEEQASLLRRMQCDEAQGYLFSRPVPAGQIEKLLRPGRAT